MAAWGEKKRVAGLSREEQERYRDEKLAVLLNHARGNVPFWREKMEGVGEITAGNAREVLKRLPEMGRREIQEDRERFVDERVAGCRLQVAGEGRPEAPSNVQRSTFNVQLSSGVPSDSSSKSQIANRKSSRTLPVVHPVPPCVSWSTALLRLPASLRCIGRMGWRGGNTGSGWRCCGGRIRM